MSRVPPKLLLALLALACDPASRLAPTLRHVQSSALLALVVLLLLDEWWPRR